MVLELAVLLAPPVVAEPPVVLPVTLAVPEVEPWLLLLVTLTLLLLITVAVLVCVEVTKLVELGPVVSIVMLSLAAGAKTLAKAALTPVLVTVALVELLLVLPAVPVVAEPPVGHGQEKPVQLLPPCRCTDSSRADCALSHSPAW